MNQLSTKSNGFVTNKTNGYGITKKQKQFLDKAKDINIISRRPFSCSDFPEFSDSNFRQMIHRLKEHIEIIVKSNPCFYKVRGVQLGRSDGFVTDHPTGEKLIWMLNQLKNQPASIHDIKIQFDSNLYETVSKIPKIETNPKNKGIFLNCELISGYPTKLLIYPTKIQIDIACTFNPIIYDNQGAIFLIILLTNLQNFLISLGKSHVQIPDFRQWIITHYHFGKDGKEEWNGESFHITIAAAFDGLTRYYSKTMPNGKKIPRGEQIRTPKIMISDELEKMFSLDVSTNFIN